MIEDRLTDQFREAVTNEPQLGFDPDDVVDRAVRNGKHRRATFGVSLAVVAVAIGAVATFTVTRPADSAPVVGSAPPTSANVTFGTEPPPQLPPACEPMTGICPSERCDTMDGFACDGIPGFAGSEEIVAKLGPGVRQVLTERVPGLELSPDSGLRASPLRRCVTGMNGNARGLLSFAVCHDEYGGVDARGKWGSPTSETMLPDGSKLKVFRDSQADWWIRVAHERVDGVSVSVRSNRVPQQDSSLLTEQVMTAVATDGRLSF